MRKIIRLIKSKCARILLLISFSTLFLGSYIEEDKENEFEKYSKLFGIRDLARYECNDMEIFDNRLRLCHDGSLKIKENDCTVLSFGSYLNDFDFEKTVLQKQSCQMDTFDPHHEADMIRERRFSNNQLGSYTVEIDEKWRFHRIGLVNSITKIEKRNSIGWMDTFKNVLNQIECGNKTIDVVKIDVKGIYLFIEKRY